MAAADAGGSPPKNALLETLDSVGLSVRNLFSPREEVTLTSGGSSGNGGEEDDGSDLPASPSQLRPPDSSSYAIANPPAEADPRAVQRRQMQMCSSASDAYMLTLDRQERRAAAGASNGASEESRSGTVPPVTGTRSLQKSSRVIL